MIMKNNKIAVFFAVVGLGLMTFSSCKKSEADDPNITYVSFNKTIDALQGGAMSIDSFDLNNDGVSEIVIGLRNMGSDTGTIQFSKKSQQFQFVAESLIPEVYVKLYVKDELPSSSSSVYQTAAYISIKVAGYRLGVVDNQERYLAFRFSTGTKYNYGWMKVQMNSAYTQFKIIDYAYNTLYDTPIKVGAK